MAYHLYTSNQLSTFIPILSEITLSQSLLSSCLVICQNKQLTNRLKKELADIGGIYGNIDFIDQNTARQKIMSLYPQAQSKYKNYFVPDVITFKLLILKILKEQDFGDSLLENYFKTSTDNEIVSIKQLSLASEVSRLFDSYNKTNPKMIYSWNRKKLISDQHDYDFQHERWQQKLMSQIFNNNNLISYNDIFQEIIKSKESPLEKKTICIIGSAFLLENNLDFLHYISSHHDIHHFCWTPCQTYFGDLSHNNNHQCLADNKTNLLLSHLGKLGRDLQNKLLDLEGIIDNSLFTFNNGSTLLSRIQQQILSGDTPSLSHTEILKKDINIEVVNAPSKLREVEILYDNILDILNNSSNILPLDILILAKDINEYESLIKTVFSRKINSYQGEASLKIPFTFLDIMAANHSSMIKGVLNVLDVINSNFSAGSILKLFQHPCFMAKFDLRNTDIDFFEKIIKKLNITSFFKEGFSTHSENHDVGDHWHKVFKRILSGFVMNDEREIERTLPFTEIRLSEYELIFKLIDISSHLLKDLKYLGALKADIKTWATHFRTIITQYLSFRDEFLERDEKFRKKIFNILEHLSDLTSQIPTLHQVDIDFPVFCNILTEKISTLTTSVHVNNHNGVSFGSIRNNRLLSAKVVCLLGMNESVFPSKTSSFNFDLRRLDPNMLDAEVTDVDKYCFLEILMTTKEKLVLSYIGKDDSTNTEMNPSILVEELIGYIENNFIVKDFNNDIKDLLIIKHPLDGFSSKYFDNTSSFFSYNSLNFRTCYLDYEKQISSLLPEVLNVNNNAIDEDLISVSIADIKQFLKNPAKFFIKNRLKIYLDEKEVPLTNAEQFFSFSSIRQYQFFKYILNNLHSMNKEELSQQVAKFIRYQTLDGSITGGVIASHQEESLLKEVAVLTDSFSSISLYGKKRCFLMPQVSLKSSFITYSQNTENLKYSSLMLDLEEGRCAEISGETGSYYSDCFINFALKEIKPKHFVDSMVDYLILRSLDIIPDTEVKSIVYGIKKQKIKENIFHLSQNESLRKLSAIVSKMMQDLNTSYFADIDCCHTVMKTRKTDTIQSKLFAVMENKALYCPYTNEFLKVTNYLDQDGIADFAKNVYKGLII